MESTIAFATTDALDILDAPQDSLSTSVVKLTATVATLTADQMSLPAQSWQLQQQKPLPNQGTSDQRWRNVETWKKQGA